MAARLLAAPALAAALLVAVLVGCQPRPDDPRPPAASQDDAASAPAEPPEGPLGISPQQARSVTVGPFVVSAIGARDGEVLRVRRLEVRHGDRPGLLQVIEGLDSETPWSDAAPGLQVHDMDFDGHLDFRLMEFRAAGPNTPWRHWLFEPARGRFGPSDALDAVSPTRFDAARRLVIVDWRDGAARSGSDTYRWQGPTLHRQDRTPRD